MGTGYTVAEFLASISDAATGVLPYIGAGVGAGVIVMAVSMGITKGLKVLRKVANAG